MTLYKINPLRIEKIPLTIKNYPWPCGSKLRSKPKLLPVTDQRLCVIVLRKGFLIARPEN